MTTPEQKRRQTKAMVNLYGQLKITAFYAENLAKEFTGSPITKSAFIRLSDNLKSKVSDFTVKMNRDQIEAFRKVVNEERTAQLDNILNLLQGVPQSNLDEIESVLIEINNKY